jgi:anti-sigma-K factor RskA
MFDDDRDALAAEYVLGTLSADEREQAEALIAIDGGFAELVRLWERRLGELNVMVEAVEPSPDVWEKIRSEVDGAAPTGEFQLPAIEEPSPQTAPEPTPPELNAPDLPPDLASEMAAALAPESAPDLSHLAPEPAQSETDTEADTSSAVANLASSLLPPAAEPDSASLPPSPGEHPSPPAQPSIERSADVVDLAQRLRRSRGITYAVGALAAVLALYVAVAQFAPRLMPLGRQSPAAVTAQVQPPADRLVAVLQQEPNAPAFLLTVDPQARTLTVRTVSATPETGRSYELWLISSKFPQPRSLGVVGSEQFTRRPIPANFDADTVRTASYAVSLEPAGGSPSGVPTGPILFTGKLVDALPGSPPS